MDTKEPVYFDLDTVLLLRETLEDAWAGLLPEQRATTSKTLLAERFLKAAAEGERDPKRLVNAALVAVAA
jgi:hypothetical protein